MGSRKASALEKLLSVLQIKERFADLQRVHDVAQIAATAEGEIVVPEKE